jgi:hypothetical protein
MSEGPDFPDCRLMVWKCGSDGKKAFSHNVLIRLPGHQVLTVCPVTYRSTGVQFTCI